MPIIHNIELKTKKGGFIYRAIIAFLAIGAVVQFLPLFWMIVGTFKTDLELIQAVPKVFPANWSVAAYADAFAKYKIWENIWNTVILCVSIILLQVSNSALSAYALSKMRPRFGKQIFLIIIGTMMFSSVALMFPLYIMVAQMGLIGSKMALILSSGAWAYSIFLFKSFFDSIPSELMESAKIDGASDMRIFGTVILPLSKPVFAVNILNTFMAVYNDFAYPLMLLPDKKDWTIMIRLFNIEKMGAAVQPSLLYVLMVVATLPVLIIYLFAQKNIVEGISTTGIKG